MRILKTIVFAVLVTTACTPSGKTDSTGIFLDSLNNSGTADDLKSKLARERGFTHYNSGDLQPAQRLFEYAAVLDSNNILNLYALALVGSRNGDFNKSLRLLTKVVQQDSLGLLGAYGSMATIYSFQDNYGRADSIVDQMLLSDNPKIRREAYSIAAVLSIRKGSMLGAVDFMKLRIPLSKKLYNRASGTLEHPYWDHHLIGNIYLAMHWPDSAKAIMKEGLKLLDTGENRKTARLIRSDHNYFESMYLFEKGRYDASHANFISNFDQNKNGYGGIWARILIEKNRPDSALTVLGQYCHQGFYYTKFLEGKAYLKAGRPLKADALFKEVLGFHQIGEWYWQHEYALICDEIAGIYATAPELNGNE